MFPLTYVTFFTQGFINIKWAKWKRVLLTRSIAMVPTIAVALAATKDLDKMSSWLNVLQSVQLPFALLPILHFTSDSRIMGQFKNGGYVGVILFNLFDYIHTFCSDNACRLVEQTCRRVRFINVVKLVSQL